jgi:hypothetical protein
MLDFFHRLARRLVPYEILLWGLVLSCVGVFVAVLLMSTAPRENALALVSITALVWALLLITILRTFAVPETPLEPGTSLWSKCKWRLRRGLLWLLALTLAALCAAVTVFSLRAIGIVLR